MQQLPSLDPEDPDFRRLKYVRYADDFLLGLYIRYHKGARMRVVTSTWAPRDTIK